VTTNVDAGRIRPDASPTVDARGPKNRDGFSLLEIILVVTIILIASAIAIPSFVRSYEGARLNTSARTIATASKYARNMAVLRQQHMAILFDTHRNEIEILTLGAGAGRSEQGVFLDRRAGHDRRWDADPEQTTIESLKVRPMENGVRILGVSDFEGRQRYDGIYWVNYYPSGMSDKYTVRLGDARNRTVRMEVDHISGRFSVEFGR